MPNATKRRRSRSNEPYSPYNAIPEVPANMDGQAEPSPKRPRRVAACTRPSLVESDGEGEEEEPKPKKRGRLTSKGNKTTTTKTEKLKEKDEKRKDYLPPPEPPYLHEGLARRSPDSVAHVRVDAHGLANGHLEQTSEKRYDPPALDASIDPALQSCTVSPVAGLHHFDLQSMSNHPQALDSSAISVVHHHAPDPAPGAQGVAHYPDGAFVGHPGNPQAKPQSPWPDLPIRPPWVCPYPLCDRQGKPFAQKSALERHIKSQHLGIRGAFAIHYNIGTTLFRL